MFILTMTERRTFKWTAMNSFATRSWQPFIGSVKLPQTCAKSVRHLHCEQWFRSYPTIQNALRNSTGQYLAQTLRSRFTCHFHFAR